jgi:hypothetical protein
MPLRAVARLIQTMLYAQRFFPYYVYNILGGIEEDGEPRPFSAFLPLSLQPRPDFDCSRATLSFCRLWCRLLFRPRGFL